jgi:hypothetical protein
MQAAGTAPAMTEGIFQEKNKAAFDHAVFFAWNALFYHNVS